MPHLERGEYLTTAPPKIDIFLINSSEPFETKGFPLLTLSTNKYYFTQFHRSWRKLQSGKNSRTNIGMIRDAGGPCLNEHQFHEVRVKSRSVPINSDRYEQLNDRNREHSKLWNYFFLSVPLASRTEPWTLHDWWLRQVMKNGVSPLLTVPYQNKNYYGKFFMENYYLTICGRARAKSRSSLKSVWTWLFCLFCLFLYALFNSWTHLKNGDGDQIYDMRR